RLSVVAAGPARVAPVAARPPAGAGHAPRPKHGRELLRVHPPRLVEAVVEVGHGLAAVADRGVGVLFDRSPRPGPDLGRLDSPGPEPAGEQVEEVDPVLDEDTTALTAVPEPVPGRQVLVRRVVLEGPVEHLTQHPCLD